MADKITPSDVYSIEGLRNNIVNEFNGHKPVITQLQDDISDANALFDSFAALNIDSKLSNLNPVAFFSVDVTTSTDSKLFGEIAQVIESAITEEINEISELKESTYSRHATPDLVLAVSQNKLRAISDDILKEGTDEEANMRFAVRYMELYNEASKSSENVSDKSNDKISENNEFLYFLGSKILPSERPEGHIGDVINYTVAVVSNIKDGTVPDIAKFKENISESINNGLNHLVNSDNIKISIEAFKDLESMFKDCDRVLSDYESGDKFRDAIDAMRDVCAKQLEHVEADIFER